MSIHRLFVLLLVLALICPPERVRAELNWVDVGVDGLTCSMCTRSVEMSIRRLDFVDSVAMSLEETQGRVFLKKGVLVDFQKIARAVVNAGFSVRFLRVALDLEKVRVNPTGCFTDSGITFQWLQFDPASAKGNVRLKLVDEGLITRKEAAQWKRKMGATVCGEGQTVYHVAYE
jgi:copper chaperone CopZ